MKGLLYPGGPHRALLSFNPPFPLTRLNLEGNKDITRKGMKFWIKRLIINSAEELGFRKTQFQHLLPNLEWHPQIKHIHISAKKYIDNSH